MGSQEEKVLRGPDLKVGVDMVQLVDSRPFLGHFEGKQLVLVKRGAQVFAVGAECSHYGGPLDEGLVTDRTIRCPWHHARFDLTTGENVAAPGLSPIGCWEVEIDQGRACVIGKLTPTLHHQADAAPKHVVILGGGAAGAACAQTLRALDYMGTITLLSEEPFPVDRPNLSKDFLAGEAPPEWLPILDEEAMRELRIDFVQARVDHIDSDSQRLEISGRDPLEYDALVLATGSSPRRLPIQGADLPHVFTLRQLADAEAIRQRAANAKRAVIIGASFIGLEAAASLTKQGLEVHVVAPEEAPLAGLFGEQVAAIVREDHESHGVTFHLGRKTSRIEADEVVLDDGQRLPAELVVVGVGVTPNTALAEALGLTVEDGVLVDEAMRAAPGIWAVGDIARVNQGGGVTRIEHWAVARRHGQRAARDILGIAPGPMPAPFFWSAHFDVTLNYVGHAEGFDAILVHGDLEAREASLAYKKGDRILAVLSLNQDLFCLQAEHLLERDDQEELAAMFS